MERPGRWSACDHVAGEFLHARRATGRGAAHGGISLSAQVHDVPGQPVGHVVWAFPLRPVMAQPSRYGRRGRMSQDAYYRENEAYAEFLAGWDAAFYAKYADTLKPAQTGRRVLDVGCGVGQVVARLGEAGFEAHGVDVSAPNIARAQRFCPR